MRTKLIIVSLLIGITFQQCSIGCLRCNNDNQCQLCDVSNNYYLNGNTCTLSQQTNCLVISQNDSCSLCSPNFYLDANTQRCIAVGGSNIVSNCRTYNSGQVCTACSGSFFISAGNCLAVNATVSNCQSYSDNGVCNGCTSEFILNSDLKTCTALPANQNCLFYTFVGCKKCASGFVQNQNLYFTNMANPAYIHSNFLVNLITPRSSWIALRVCQAVTIQNCASFNAFNNCNQCMPEFYLSNGDCIAFPKPIIFGCITYSNPTTCSVCQTGMFLSLNTCQNNIPIDNCQIYLGNRTLTTCSECAGDYYLQGNTCVIRSSSQNIERCTTRAINDDSCQVCNSGFVLTSDNRACLTALANCHEYSSSTSQSQAHSCSRCNDGFYLTSSGTVTICTSGTIANCRVYTSNGNTCETCQNGFYISGTSCLAHVPIAECKTYSSTRKNFCQTCNIGFYNFAYSTVCEPATALTGCKVYSADANSCQECESNYYLINQKCTIIPSSFSKCQDFSGTVCNRCNTDYMVNDPADKNCILPLDYVTSDISSPCSVLKRFAQTSTIATWMDPTGNGDDKSTITCHTCSNFRHAYKPLNAEAICVLTTQLPLYSGYVAISECKRYGLNYAAVPSIVCMECNTGFYITGYHTLGYTTAAKSTNNANGITCTATCTLNGDVTGSTIIPDDMLGFINICVAANAAGFAKDTPFEFNKSCQRAGRTNGGILGGDFTKNVDFDKDNVHSADYFCFLAYDDSVAATTSLPSHYLYWKTTPLSTEFSFNKPAAGIQLSENVDFTSGYSGEVDKSTFAPSVFNFNGILSSIAPISKSENDALNRRTISSFADCNLYASIQGKNNDDNAANTFLGPAATGLADIATIFYVPMGNNIARNADEVPGTISKNVQSFAHFCLRCNMGYELKFTPNNDEKKNWPQPHCVQMTNCGSTTSVYGGLPTFLNSVFSCHACSPIAGIATFPSIYIETDGIETSRTGRMFAWAVAKIYTGINAVLDDHGFRCAVAPTAVRTVDETAANAGNIADTQLTDVSDCAAYAYIQPVSVTGEAGNTAVAEILNDDGSVKDAAVAASVPGIRSAIISAAAGTYGITDQMAGSSYFAYGIPICVACAGRHFPTYYDPNGDGKTLVSGVTKIPAWTVTACTEGLKCAITNSQFNSCSGCDTSKESATTPEYYAFSDFTVSNCYRTVTRNCFILATASFSTASTTNACEVCKAGYIKNLDGYCESYTVPNQPSTNTSFRHSYFASKAYTGTPPAFVVQTNFAVKISYLLNYNQLQYGVSSCLSGWTLAPANTWAPDVCVHSSYVSSNSGAFITNSKFVDRCLRYNTTIPTGAGSYLCGGCSTGYIPTIDGTSCVPNANIPSCVFAQNGSNNSPCYECLPNFRNINGKCLTTTIANCKTYVHNQWSYNDPATLQCSACMDRFYLSTNSLTCESGVVTNCIAYTQGSSTRCTACSAGYVLLSLTNAFYCYPIHDSLKCKMLADTSANPGINSATISCSECQNTSTAVYGTKLWNTLGRESQAQTFCMPFTLIDNCSSYDQESNPIAPNTFACKKCANEFYYFADKRICKRRTIQPSRCSEYSETSDACTACSPGSFLSNEGKSCTVFPDGIYKCSQYSSATTCTQCKPEYYLNENACVASTKINNCLVYSAENVCSACNPGFFLVDSTTCSPATAVNCLTYSSINACASCASDKGLQSTNGITSCVPVNLNRCKTATSSAPFTCLVCDTGYFPNASGECQNVSQSISNCVVYDTATTCLTCSPNSVLNVARTVCNSTFYNNLIDPNCDQSFLKVDPSCAVCPLGSFFSNGTCTTCSNNTLASGCLSCDPLKQDVCLSCRPSFYMNDKGTCISVNPTPTPNPNPVPVPPSNVSILARTFAFTLLLLALIVDRN